EAALRRPVEALITRKVGEAAETLDRGEDPKMGYVVADSQLAKLKDKGAVAAFMNPGGVRRNLEAGPLTYGDLIEVQPFNNTLVLVDLTGSQIRTLLEQGAASGRFLIPSAGTWFEVKDGKLGRVVIAGEDLDEAKTYRIVVNSFIAGGGDSLGVLATATTKTDTGLLDIDAFVEFVTANSPLKVTEVNRIRRG
ncbi:MAG: 5'-nucleotidase C-terminal domain-containing protein, partial [Fimbriimonadaceae bacterium]|nr:5'-nucleotidase C-terminal domain-containing protein [Fimbriimonadaceae bacterium]